MTYEPFPSDPRTRVLRAIEAIAAGRMVILVDDEDRENEGDLVMAADKVTPDAINFMATHGRGLICLPMTSGRIEALGLPMMVTRNRSPYQTAFTVSIEASSGVTTGISAADRARTIAVAVAADSGPADLVSPGHIFPLRARDGGVLVRAGQTEGSVDLARLAGCSPAGIVCEIMNEDGTMSRLPQLLEFAQEHDLPVLTVADLIGYRLHEEPQVTRVAQGVVETDILGTVDAHVFRNRVNDLQYLVLVKGEITPDEPTLVRVHSSDVWTDALTVLRQDGGPQLQRSLRLIERAGAGVVLYIFRPFDAKSVLRRLESHALELDADVPPVATGGDPYPTGLRDYGLGAQVLRAMGVRNIRLITNSDRRLVGVQGYGIVVDERVPVPVDDEPADLRALAGGKN